MTLIMREQEKVTWLQEIKESKLVDGYKLTNFEDHQLVTDKEGKIIAPPILQPLIVK